MKGIRFILYSLILVLFLSVAFSGVNSVSAKQTADIVDLSEVSANGIRAYTQKTDFPLIANGVYPSNPLDYSIKTHELNIEEEKVGSFSLGEKNMVIIHGDVKFRAAKIYGKNIEGLSEENPVTLILSEEKKFETALNGSIYLNETILEINNLTRIKENEAIKISLQFFISVKPGCEQFIETNIYTNDNVITSPPLAESVNPIVVKAAQNVVVVGAEKQSMGDIIISEAIPGAVPSISGNNLLKIAVVADDSEKSAAEFESADVDVIKGDIKIGDISFDPDTHLLVIPVLESSKTASIIRISNIKLNVFSDIKGDVLNVTFGGNIIANYTVKRTDRPPGTFDLNMFLFPSYALILGDKEVGKSQFPYKIVMRVGTSAITVSEKDFELDAPLVLKNGSTLVPLGSFARAMEEFGVSASWDQRTKTVLFKIEESPDTSLFEVGSNIVVKGGRAVYFGGEPCTIIDDKVFVPIRAFAEIALDSSVSWDAETQAVVIN